MQALLNQSSVLLAAMEASINNSHLEPHTSHYTPMLYKKKQSHIKDSRTMQSYSQVIRCHTIRSMHKLRQWDRSICRHMCYKEVARLLLLTFCPMGCRR
jgi:hypothetical protein